MFRLFRYTLCCVALICTTVMLLPAQSKSPRFLSFEPADSIHCPRSIVATGIGVGAYSASMIGLWQAWYADYPIGRFHTFNDNKEWMQVDKVGHLYSTYQEARLVAGIYRWAGLPRKKAAWAGMIGAQLFQTSFEVMDGFSTQWGFSWGDIAFNTAGAGLFLGQELGWKDQRITLKISSMPVKHPNIRIEPYQGTGPAVSLQERSDELYGNNAISLFLKNYNASTMWLSVNPRSFSQRENGWFPPWLNVAVGHGADNMYAGFGYAWSGDKDCEGGNCPQYAVDPAQFPRTRQWFLSFDIDLTRVRCKNRMLRTLLYGINIIKIPSPTLELNSRGVLRFHPLYF